MRKLRVLVVALSTVGALLSMAGPALAFHEDIEPNNNSCSTAPPKDMAFDTNTGTLGGTDTDDYYYFYAGNDRQITVRLDPRGNDFDVYLYTPACTGPIASSLNGGPAIDSFTYYVPSSGYYKVRVALFTGSGPYDLRVTVGAQPAVTCTASSTLVANTGLSCSSGTAPYCASGFCNYRYTVSVNGVGVVAGNNSGVVSCGGLSLNSCSNTNYSIRTTTGRFSWSCNANGTIAVTVTLSCTVDLP